jgi:hypothetical protein
MNLQWIQQHTKVPNKWARWVLLIGDQPPLRGFFVNLNQVFHFLHSFFSIAIAWVEAVSPGHIHDHNISCIGVAFKSFIEDVVAGTRLFCCINSVKNSMLHAINGWSDTTNSYGRSYKIFMRIIPSNSYSMTWYILHISYVRTLWWLYFWYNVWIYCKKFNAPCN